VGIHIGTFYGNLKNGLGIKFNLFAANGEIRFYLKNGKEVWVHVHVSIIFDGTFDEDVKIITL
jgi:hypothetical protein